MVVMLVGLGSGAINRVSGLRKNIYLADVNNLIITLEMRLDRDIIVWNEMLPSDFVLLITSSQVRADLARKDNAE